MKPPNLVRPFARGGIAEPDDRDLIDLREFLAAIAAVVLPRTGRFDRVLDRFERLP